jgi:hypothetical protein
MTNLSHFTNFGLPAISCLPLGVAGLRSSERCPWVTAPPPARKAVPALGGAGDGIDFKAEGPPGVMR